MRPWITYNSRGVKTNESRSWAATVAFVAAAGMLLSTTWVPAQAQDRRQLQSQTLRRAQALRTGPALIEPLATSPRGPAIGGARGDQALAHLALRSDRGRVVDRVIIVSVDGLRPDAIGDETPTLVRLGQEGTRARRAETLARSLTLPSHASMLTGVGVDRHGMGHNSHRPTRGRIRFPSIFRVAAAAGLPTAMFVGKRKLLHLVREGDVGTFEVGGIFCDRVNRRALPWLAEMQEGLALVHYPDPDGAGHRDGWMSSGYRRAARRVDRCLGEVLETLARSGPMERTLVIVTADHGGHLRTHGSARVTDTRIPWLAYGGPAEPLRLRRTVNTMDTAPTALRALGLPLPEGLAGQAVLEAVRGPARRTAVWERRAD